MLVNLIFICYNLIRTKRRKFHMAKKENREGIALQCTVCKDINYLTSKNRKNTEGKLEIKKFCSKCNKTTAHKERKAA